jgi:hypothetical protein
MSQKDAKRLYPAPLEERPATSPAARIPGWTSATPWADKDLPRSTHLGRPAHPIRSSVATPAYPAAAGPEPGAVPLPSHLVA